MGVPPDRMGPYELIRRLGRGGMAETFLARRRGPGGFEQECCLKCVLAPFADDPDFRDQFLDEATLHGRLSHGNIVRVEDFGEHEGTYFLVMELVDGCDLAQLLEHFRLAGEPLPTPLSVLIATDLCQALHYAHGFATASGPLQIVHRDITPSNVLISRAGEVKLSDFGIARATQRRHRTQTGYTKGKFCYMSPEQIEASRDLDGRSDLFALGCVLYEMLAGRRAFEASGGNDPSVLPRILEGRFTPLAQARSDLDGSLTRSVDSLLQRARDDRPRDARAVLAALAPFAPQVTAREQLAALVEQVVGARRLSLPAGTIEPEASATLGESPEAPAYYAEPTQTNPLRPADDAAPERVHTRAVTQPRWRPRLGASVFVVVAAGVSTWAVSGWLEQRHAARAGQAVAGDPGLEARSRDVSSPEPAASAAKLAAAMTQPAEASQPEPEPSTAHTSALEPAASAPASPPTREAVRAGAGIEEQAHDQVALRVVVIPYGTIWIDGKRRGSTRAQLTLPAGPHRIGVGRTETPTQHYEVMLRPGRRTLEYELEGAFP